MKKVIIINGLVIVFYFIFFQFTLFAQNTGQAEVDQISVPSVTISDSNMIAFILDQLMIPEENPSQIEVIDINKNGFGEKDILRVFYRVKDSLKLSDVYFMEGLSDELKNTLHGIKFKVNVRIDAENMDQMEYESYKDPFYAILGALAEGLQRNYKDYLPINIGLKRDQEGVTMEFWGYDSTKIKFQPLEARKNIFYIYSTVRDSVIVGKE